MREFKADEVDFVLGVEFDDLDIEGNVLASGDDEADRNAEEWVRNEVERGNVWAWACVIVTAKWAGFEGWDTLGGVSCKKAEDFDQFGDLVSNAVKHLIEGIREAGWEVEASEADIKTVVDRGESEVKEAA